MYSRNNDAAAQQWSLHAEVTISHQNPNGNPGNAQTEQDDRGVRMVYSWHSTPQDASNPQQQQQQPSPQSPSSFNAPPPPSANLRQPPPTAYGFQRGNIIFTTTPPVRNHPQTWDNTSTSDDPTRLRVNVPDSGYNSEQLLSPSSATTTSQSRRTVPLQPYNRRCRSTCNIILSTDVLADGSGLVHTVRTEPCSRTQSLRCQTPTKRTEKRPENFYGCGDPWCHHSSLLDTMCRFSPVPESCEDCSLDDSCSTNRSSATNTNTFSTHCCTKPVEPTENNTSTSTFAETTKKNLRDAASQTTETREKCTSPMIKTALNEKSPVPPETVASTPDQPKGERISRLKKKYETRHKTEPLPSRFLPHECSDIKKSRNIVARSPGQLRRRSPLQKSPKSSDVLSDSERKPRTVHIDVYCTGSDADSDSSTSSNSDKDQSTSTPQTVFETDDLRVTHKRIDDANLPLSFLARSKLFANSSTSTGTQDSQPPIVEKPKRPSLLTESEADFSSLYPSQMSSYATIRDLDSSMSSVPMSWSTMSSSSCALPDFDSIAATSWKDTNSDFESLFQSGASLPRTDSRDFVPPSRFSGDQMAYGREVSTDPSVSSVLPSDSFDYADSSDRLRIKMMEEMWMNRPGKQTWKSPAVERKHLLQQQKIKEYLDRRLGEKSLPKWKKHESESEDGVTEDESEQGWSFVRDDVGKSGVLKRDGTVRRASKDTEKPEKRKALTPDSLSSAKCKSNPRRTILNHIKSPSVVNPNLALLNKSELLAKAEIFGPIIGALRKLDRHIGPAKNPDCTCEHCTRFQDLRRGRTRSFGDEPMGTINWKEQLSRSERLTLEQKNPNYSDF